MLIRALQSQDMYLAGSFLMFLAFLTVIGVLISDIALAILDPRIRLGGGSVNDFIIPKPGEPLAHYVSTAPFDPYLVEPSTTALAMVGRASQWKLMWWQFKQHKLALYSGVFLLLAYLSIFICRAF